VSVFVGYADSFRGATRFPVTAAAVVIERKDSTWDIISAVGTIAAAIGTLLAVLAALYINVWRERRSRPKLHLQKSPPVEFSKAGENPLARSSDWAFWKPDPDADETANFLLMGETLRREPPNFAQFNLSVSNGRNRKTAHDVEVLLTVSRYEPGEPNIDLYEGGWMENVIDHQPLVWRESDRPIGSGTRAIQIPPGVTRKITLLFVGPGEVIYERIWPHGPKGSARTNLDNVRGLFATFPLDQNALQEEQWIRRDQPDDRFPDTGRFRLKLTLTSSDTDSTSYGCELSFSEDDSYAPGVVTQPVLTDLKLKSNRADREEVGQASTDRGLGYRFHELWWGHPPTER
jgi:hypothetical protein